MSLIPLFHIDPNRPELINFLFGGICEVSFFFSPIVIIFESVPIQKRCRYEYSGESAQAQEFITIRKITLEHATRKLRNQLRIS